MMLIMCQCFLDKLFNFLSISDFAKNKLDARSFPLYVRIWPLYQT